MRPAPLTPDLASQTMPALAVDHPRLEQRPDGEIRRRRIAAGIGDQARRPNPLPAELRQPVGRFGQQRRLRMLGLVPLLVALGGTEAEGAAQVDDLHAGREQGWRQIERNLGRRCQEYGRQFLGSYSFRSGWDSLRTSVPARQRTLSGIAAMLEQNRLDRAVAL